MRQTEGAAPKACPSAAYSYPSQAVGSSRLDCRLSPYEGLIS